MNTKCEGNTIFSVMESIVHNTQGWCVIVWTQLTLLGIQGAEASYCIEYC